MRSLSHSTSSLQHNVLQGDVVEEEGVEHGPHLLGHLAVPEDQGLAHVISLPKGLVSHQPSDIYASLQLVPGDVVADLGVHDVTGPLGHALDHLDDGDELHCWSWWSMSLSEHGVLWLIEVGEDEGDLGPDGHQILAELLEY